MTSSVLRRAGAFVRGLTGWRAGLLAWSSGVLSALSFAPFGLFPFLLASLGCLLLLLDTAGISVRRAAILGWWWGFGQFLAGLYWVGYAFMVDPGAHAWQLPFAVLFLAGGLALFPALACAVTAALGRSGPSALVFAAAMSLSEWLRGHVFTGFPWNLTAYCWGLSPAILQSATLVGAYGLTLLTILFGASLSELFRDRPRLRLPGALMLAFALMWAGGEARLVLTPTRTVAGTMLRIVQPNVPQAEKYKLQFVSRNWARLIGPSTAPATAPITILIWPEAAPPFLLQHEPVAVEEIARLTAKGLVLITGGERVAFDREQEFRFYNSLLIFGRQGRVLAVYDKFHLVPFGEYVPFSQLLSRFGITKLTRGEAGFSAGPGPMTFALPKAPSVAPLICYEILFPGAVVGEARPGWFVNVTDDSWFGPSTGPYQHLLAARVRAIEEGIPVVRAANTGISAVIDPLGRTIATLGLNKFGALDVPLPAVIAPTPYARFGDLVFWLALIACGTVGWVYRRN
jgi:apolipoprotein N-acyltransferase